MRATYNAAYSDGSGPCRIGAVTPVDVEGTTTNSDPVLPLWREALRLRHQINSGAYDDEDDANKITDKVCAVEHEMARTQATSIQGLFAKIECLWNMSAPLDYEHIKQYVYAALLQGIYEDGARLAAGGGS